LSKENGDLAMGAGESGSVIAAERASGCLQSLMKNPYEMGSEKGKAKERRKIRRPQVIENIGSSGWIRTSNPPVNSRMLYR
jgi:hypothetical protein